LHGAGNYSRDDLADEHGTVRDHHVVAKLRVADTKHKHGYCKRY